MYETGYSIVVAAACAVYFRGFLACPPRYFETILYVIIIIILILLFLREFFFVRVYYFKRLADRSERQRDRRTIMILCPSSSRD